MLDFYNLLFSTKRQKFNIFYFLINYCSKFKFQKYINLECNIQFVPFNWWNPIYQLKMSLFEFCGLPKKHSLVSTLWRFSLMFTSTSFIVTAFIYAYNLCQVNFCVSFDIRASVHFYFIWISNFTNILLEKQLSHWIT